MALKTFEDLLPELKDNIFEYIRGKELFNLSLVCHSWYDHMAGSSMCMNKIRIRIKGQYKQMTLETKELLKYSKRKYQHMYAGLCSNQMDRAVDILSGPGKSWRIFHLDDIKFITMQDYEKCLSSIEDTILEVHFEQVGILRPSSYRIDYFFPHLRVLNLLDCHWSINEPFMYVNQLRELCLYHEYPIFNTETFSRILILNENLKVLSLPAHCFESLVDREVTDEIKFKIENLTVSRIVHPNVYQPNNIYLNYFLKAQFRSIKKLSLAEWMGIEVLTTIFDRLINLEELTLLNIENAEDTIKWNKLIFPRNDTILDFNYQDKSECFDIFNALLAATPKIKTLKAYSLTQMMLDFSIHKLDNLEHLSTTFLDLTEIKRKNILLNLKSYTGLIYDHRIQTNLVSKTREERSHFENMLYDNFNEKSSKFTLNNYVLKVKTTEENE